MGLLTLLLLAIASTRAGTGLEGWTPPIAECVESPSVYHSCAKLDNSLRCAHLLEACLAIAHPDRVQRSGAAVSMRLASNERLSFTDHVAVEADVELSPIPGLAGKPLYSAVEYVERAGKYVVHVQLYESNGYLIVNEVDGRITAVRSRPEFSPDGKYVAAVGTWGVGAGSELQIWRLDPVDPQLAFSLFVDRPPPYESMRTFEPVGWDSNSVLRFTDVTYSAEKGWSRTLRRLARRESGWSIEP